VPSPRRRIRRATLVASLGLAVALSAGCQGKQLVGGGLALREECFLGCGTPSPPVISPTSVVTSGRAYLDVRGETTGRVRARTTTYQLKTGGQWVDVARTVGEGTGADNARDLWAHIFIDQEYRPGILATGYATLRIVESDGNAEVRRVIIADHAELFVSAPSELAFTATVGASQTQTIPIRNTSATLPLKMHRVDVRSFDGGFKADMGDCPSYVEPRGGCSLSITFTPTKAGVVTDRLTIDTNDLAPGEITLSGTGVAPAPATPRVSLSPADTTLAELEEGVVTVTNPGTSAVTTGTASFIAASAGAVFHTTSGADPARDCWGGTTLAPGASCEVTVSFSGAPPSDPSPWATLGIPVTGGDTATATIHGTQAAIMSTSAANAAPRRAKTTRIHFGGRLSTATRIAAAERQTVAGGLAIDLTGAMRTTTSAPEGTAVPSSLKRLLGSRFAGGGTLVSRGPRTIIDTNVLTAPGPGGRLCARLRISGTRTAATGTLTVLGGTGPAAGLRAMASFELFKGDRATGIATVSTGRARPMPAACTG
jgi:hypothetical protein